MLDQMRELLDRARRRVGPNSQDSARQRLQVVLVQDRSSLSPEALESMKNDLVGVVSKYLLIDREAIEVQVKRADGGVVLVSNIPILGAPRAAPGKRASAN